MMHVKSSFLREPNRTFPLDKPNTDWDNCGMGRLTQPDRKTIRQAAAMLGALGGSAGGTAKTPKKQRASRINGKLGGRPPKKGKRHGN